MYISSTWSCDSNDTRARRHFSILPESAPSRKITNCFIAHGLRHLFTKTNYGRKWCLARALFVQWGVNRDHSFWEFFAPPHGQRVICATYLFAIGFVFAPLWLMGRSTVVCFTNGNTVIVTLFAIHACLLFFQLFCVLGSYCLGKLKSTVCAVPYTFLRTPAKFISSNNSILKYQNILCRHFSALFLASATNHRQCEK